MNDSYGITDSAPVNFFSMIPHLVDDAKLSPQAKALYLHLKRVTGEAGVCWKTQDQLAKHCGFSPKVIVKAKRELIEAKLIEIKLETFKGHPQHIIHLLNVWVDNERKYRQSVPEGNRSPCRLGTDIGSHPVVTKKNPKEKPLKKNPDSISSSSKKPRALKLHSRPIFASMQKHFGFPERTDKDPIPNYGKEAKAIERMKLRGYSEDEILDAWRKKVTARGEFVSMTWVNEDIGKPDRPKQPWLLPKEDDLVAQAKEKGL